eukprot:1939946-Amphidinium_carterae.1
MDQAQAHWPFFLGLVENQLPRIFNSEQQAGVPLCVSARLVEVTVLFLCDALALHGIGPDALHAGAAQD